MREEVTEAFDIGGSGSETVVTPLTLPRAL
jgi:hypothetical protein